MPSKLISWHFDYCRFVASFEILKCKTSKFILLSLKETAGGFLQFYVNLQIVFFFFSENFGKNILGIFIEIALNL